VAGAPVIGGHGFTVVAWLLLSNGLVGPFASFEARGASMAALSNPAKAAEIQAGCLALNAYHESRGQPVAGQLLTMLVVMNRVVDSRYPATPCEVIYDGPVVESWKRDGTMIPVRDMCQFSWWCDGESDAVVDTAAYIHLYELAKAILAGEVFDFSEGATHYHSTDVVDPGWGFQPLGQIGDHIYYRRP
jgi:spore germination cell wall hydrolase CwlJ-like protein